MKSRQHSLLMCTAFIFALARPVISLPEALQGADPWSPFLSLYEEDTGTAKAIKERDLNSEPPQVPAQAQAERDTQANADPDPDLPLLVLAQAEAQAEAAEADAQAQEEVDTAGKKLFAAEAKLLQTGEKQTADPWESFLSPYEEETGIPKVVTQERDLNSEAAQVLPAQAQLVFNKARIQQKAEAYWNSNDQDHPLLVLTQIEAHADADEAEAQPDTAEAHAQESAELDAMALLLEQEVKPEGLVVQKDAVPQRHTDDVLIHQHNTQVHQVVLKKMPKVPRQAGDFDAYKAEAKKQYKYEQTANSVSITNAERSAGLNAASAVMRKHQAISREEALKHQVAYLMNIAAKDAAAYKTTVQALDNAKLNVKKSRLVVKAQEDIVENFKKQVAAAQRALRKKQEALTKRRVEMQKARFKMEKAGNDYSGAKKKAIKADNAEKAREQEKRDTKEYTKVAKKAVDKAATAHAQAQAHL